MTTAGVLVQTNGLDYPCNGHWAASWIPAFIFGKYPNLFDFLSILEDIANLRHF
jgi:hypothetical protein